MNQLERRNLLADGISKTEEWTHRKILEAFWRVARFEGMTLEDFDEQLPKDCPSEIRKEVIDRLSRIIASRPGGDPGRIDPWGEAQQAAILLRKKMNPYLNTPMEERDPAVYIQELSLEKLEGDRDEMLRRFSVPEEDGTSLILALRNYPTRYIDSLRGAGVFLKLAPVIEKRHPEMLKDRRLTVLYPAGGAHLAPLLTAFQLIDRKQIDEAKFTFTDIDRQYVGKIERQLMFLLGEKAISDYMITTPKSFPGGGEEYSFEFLYKEKKISITLALNRSGEDYWRPEEAEKADWVVIHDAGGWEESEKLYRRLMDERRKNGFRPLLAMVEGRIKESGQLAFKPDLPFDEIEGQYGHCAQRVPTVAPKGAVETGLCEHASALLVRLP